MRFALFLLVSLRAFAFEGEFVTVPVGDTPFVIGSPVGEIGRATDENQNPVLLSDDFEISTTEVTQMDWFGVTGNNPSKFRMKFDCPETFIKKKNVEICPDHPVDSVSWNLVQDFLNKLNNSQELYLYRLPTEAEWEFAARAGSRSLRYYGDQSGSEELAKHAWFFQVSRNQTQTVGALLPNAFGLYDIYGNVWEWVFDWYAEEYPSVLRTNPQGPDRGKYKVVRGCAWSSVSVDCRSAKRSKIKPSLFLPFIGFRVVRVPIEYRLERSLGAPKLIQE